MANRKTDNALRLLAALDELPRSGPVLAMLLGVSLSTVARLVVDLRDMGCQIEAVREGHSDWSYHLRDWGVFNAERVRRYVKWGERDENCNA